MRILYDSKLGKYKTPFGTLTEGEMCHVCVHIPVICRTREAQLMIMRENGASFAEFSMVREGGTRDYDFFACDFSITERGLYFYYFRIRTEKESFSLYRADYDQTNMEAGGPWQLSCIPADFHVPRDYWGHVMYQIFPDRFYAVGRCDVRDKLKPFFLHEDKREPPCYLPNAAGRVENCDFYGGNLHGITAKLDYLASLGVRVIYLNPIFKAWSNHRYDTADYMKIDELLGDEQALRTLCEQAHARDMRVILDGVFSHTGSNSRYFDKESVFGGGAYHNPDSPYRAWYDFVEYPHRYASWWGIETLPCVREMEESYRRFIIDDEDSVIAHWLRVGVDGFRLDVADELPDAFIAALRARLKALKPDALLIGEVWEDASSKISYGERRRYFTDGELDSVMNYPFREAILSFVTGRDNGTQLVRTVMTIAENYPREVLFSLMNSLSTHDTPRILTLLSPEGAPSEKHEQATFRMSAAARACAERRLRAAAFLQFVLPGMPCIYYGDEIGMEGCGDPFSRGYFEWDKVPGNVLLDFFATLSRVRESQTPLLSGDVRVRGDAAGRVIVERRAGDLLCRATVNMGEPLFLTPSGEILLQYGVKNTGDGIWLEECGFLLECRRETP